MIECTLLWIDAFELWCWRRLLRVPWTAKRSNQSILKEINPVIPLEGMMLKLKLQYFGHLMRRVDSLEKWCWEGLGAGGEGDDRGWDGWMASWLDGRESEWTPGVGDGQGGLACWFMELQRVGHDWVAELNWRWSWVWGCHLIPLYMPMLSLLDTWQTLCFYRFNKHIKIAARCVHLAFFISFANICFHTLSGRKPFIIFSTYNKGERKYTLALNNLQFTKKSITS